MWAHYANNYAGICIGYQPHPLLKGLPKNFHLVRVSYGNDLPPLSVHDLLNHNDAARKILSHKKASWVYEREWRLLGPLGLHPIKSKTGVRELYIGLHIQPKYKERILDELKNVPIRISDMQVTGYDHEWVELKKLK
jgi:hypothetical protein